jgi:hypothetical protein
MTEPNRGDGAIRRSSVYGSSTESTYAGLLSFMWRRYTRELNGVDVAISGVPLVSQGRADGACVFPLRYMCPIRTSTTRMTTITPTVPVGA